MTEDNVTEIEIETDEAEQETFASAQQILEAWVADGGEAEAFYRFIDFVQAQTLALAANRLEAVVLSSEREKRSDLEPEDYWRGGDDASSYALYFLRTEAQQILYGVPPEGEDGDDDTL